MNMTQGKRGGVIKNITQLLRFEYWQFLSAVKKIQSLTKALQVDGRNVHQMISGSDFLISEFNTYLAQNVKCPYLNMLLHTRKRGNYINGGWIWYVQDFLLTGSRRDDVNCSTEHLQEWEDEEVDCANSLDDVYQTKYRGMRHIASYR